MAHGGLGPRFRASLALVTGGEVHRRSTVARRTQEPPEIRQPTSPRTVIGADRLPGRSFITSKKIASIHTTPPNWTISPGVVSVSLPANGSCLAGVKSMSQRREVTDCG